MPSNPSLSDLATNLGLALKKNSDRLATAESCTGGLLAATCTSVSGSSAWFDCGLATYSLDAKQRILNVSAETLNQYGAVSDKVAIEMVSGVLASSQATLAVSITGVAGPEGGDIDCPVGTVWFAFAAKNNNESKFELIQTSRHQFEGDRDAVRNQAVRCALEGLNLIMSDQQDSAI